MQFRGYPSQREAAHRKSIGRLTLLVAAATAALVIGMVAGYQRGDHENSPTSRPAAAKIEVFDETQIQTLYDTAINAVAKVETSQTSAGSPSFRQRGQGSAFLVDGEGNFLTNNHVVEGATRVTIILHNGRRLPGTVAGTDTSNDLAVVKVEAEGVAGLVPLGLADSSQVRPGQLAIALGSPFGLEGSVTVGVVSGINRSLPSSIQRPIVNLIQTDAAIFPGNSGGPLLNSRGEVIGINTAVATAGNESLGFAVPSNAARAVLQRLTSGVRIRRPWLGVSLVAVGSEDTAGLRLGASRGVYIVGVVEGSPAERAGLRAAGLSGGLPTTGGDVIVAVDGAPVAQVTDLIALFNSKQPGDEITLTIVRNGKSEDVKITLVPWPESLN